MKTIYSKGDRVSFISVDHVKHTGTVEKQEGAILYVKWDVINYRDGKDAPHKIDYRDLEQE